MDITPTQSQAMTVGATTGASATSPTIVDDNSSNSMFGGVSKDDFLKLLVAQLRNQDPMKPMDDNQFISQVAQLNSVDQMNTLNTNLTELLSFEGLGQASTLIGKAVEAAMPDGSTVAGVVKEVTFVQGKPMLTVGNQKIGLTDVRRITSA